MEQLTIKTFEPIKQRFVELLDEKTFLKECSFAMQHLSKNSYLASSTQKSVIESVLNIAQVGLTLNPALKLAYLVPRRVGGAVTCCLEPSYQGLCKLATDTGSVKNIYAYLVYEKDVFEQILGTENKIVHKPAIGERGEFIGAYAVAVLNDGRTQTEFMDKLALFEIRDYSESYKSFKEGKSKSCIWDTSEEEMYRKTVIKRLCKYLPKTELWEKLANTIELDNQDYEVSIDQLHMIEGLLATSSIAEEKKEFISRMMNSYNKDQATRVIEDLLVSQVDRIGAGLNYKQGDIIEKQKTVGK